MFLSVARAVSAQGGATSSSPWTVSDETDRMTDKRVLTATATAQGDRSYSYEITLKCSEGRRETTIAAFAGTSGRGIGWQTEITSEVTGSARHPRVIQDERNARPIRYRIDSQNASEARLVPVHANAGRVVNASSRFLSAQTRELSAALGIDADAALGDVFEGIGLPKTRLLVADVFPNEVATFSFESLSAADRARIERACFSPEPSPRKSTAPADIDASSMWSDPGTGESLAIPDFWTPENRNNLRPLSEYGRFNKVTAALSAQPTRGEFETTAAFEQRKGAEAEARRRLLGEPLMIVGIGGDETFRYDPDSQEMWVIIRDIDSIPRFNQIRQGHVQVPTPYPDVTLVMASGPFLRSRNILDGVHPVACGFKMPVEEAKSRKANLSLLYNIGLDGAGYIPSRERNGLVVDVDKVEVWVVDKARRERVAHAALRDCIIKQ